MTKYGNLGKPEVSCGQEKDGESSLKQRRRNRLESFKIIAIK